MRYGTELNQVYDFSYLLLLKFAKGAFGHVITVLVFLTSLSCWHKQLLKPKEYISVDSAKFAYTCRFDQKIFVMRISAKHADFECLRKVLLYEVR